MNALLTAMVTVTVSKVKTDTTSVNALPTERDLLVKFHGKYLAMMAEMMIKVRYYL